MPESPQTQTASAEQLAALTLLSVSEIQGPAKAYLPRRQSGNYPLTESIKGAFRYLSEIRSGRPSISGDELREMTGLTDQRHRQLANAGYFPAPKKGRYDLKSTFSGTLKYFRELHQRRDKTLGEKRARKLDNENLFLELRNGKTLENIVDDFCSCITPALTEARQLILASKLPEDQANELIGALGRIIDDALKHKSEVARADKAEASADTDSASEAEHLAMG